jgi:hypothetical protein
VIARLSTYISTALALLVLRRRSGVGPPRFRLPGGAALAVLAIAACVAMLSQSGGRELRDVTIALALGLGLYAAHRAWRQRAAVAS